MGSFQTYYPGNSVLHRLDARVKLVLLLVCSISVFFIHSWVGLGLVFFFLLLGAFNSKISLAHIGWLLLPLTILLGIIWVCNSIILDVSSYEVASGLYAVGASDWFATGANPVVFAGSVAFSLDGFLRGLVYVLRIVFLFVATFLVTFTTTSNQLTDAFVSLMRPLRAIKVPVDDVATTLSLALRFIPLMADELHQIKVSQAARGAQFSTGPVFGRIKTYLLVLFPLVVGMFRRADTLVLAMESRCYGVGLRTQLNDQPLSAASIAALLVGIALSCILAICI